MIYGNTVFIYYCNCIVFKNRKAFQFLLGKKVNGNVPVKNSSKIKSIEYCEHCKGPCCRLPIIRQKTLVRRIPGVGSVGVKANTRSNNTRSWKTSFRSNNTGSWKTSVDANNKNHDYNLSDQFAFNNY